MAADAMAPASSAATGMPADVRPSAAALALARLNTSRSRLRQELLPAAASAAGADAGNAGRALPRRWRVLLRHWRFRLRHSVLAGVAAASLQTWWLQHPLRAPCETAGAELRSTVGPLVRRHPVATVLLAGAAGAALVAWRPWRWSWVAGQVEPLPRKLGHWLMGQLSQPAVKTMLAGLLLSVLGRAATAAHPPAEAGNPADPGTR